MMKEERYQTSVRIFTAAIILSLLALSLFNTSSASSQGNSQNATLSVNAPKKVKLGDSIEIVLTARHVANIAGYEAVVLFDTAFAEFGGVEQNNNDLKKLGRDVSPLTAVDLPGGVAVGLATCPTDDCVQHNRGRRDNGASGTVRLARVFVYPLEPGSYEIKLDAVKFIDALGSPIPVNVETDTIVVEVEGAEPFHAASGSMWQLPQTPPDQPPGPFDLTGDQQVTHADLMEVSIEWELTRLNVNPCQPEDLTRDINHDGCIDVADLQLIADNYGSQGQSSAGFRSVAYRTASAMLQSSTNFVVNSNGDAPDAAAGNGVCSTNWNSCTLRAAIMEANALPGPSTISFNIPGSGVKNVKLTGRLPTINDANGPVTIDGYTQPGASPNTDPLASNASIIIQLEGMGEDRFDGFTITSPGNSIRGVSIFKVRRSFWIYGVNADNNRVTGSFVGTNAAGTYGAPATASLAHGFHIEQGASSNRIGDTSPGDRNVISGNGSHGLGIWHQGSNSNVVLNNIVGLNPRGDGRLPNWTVGLDINYGSASNIFGGTGAGERNVTSGNEKSGIEVSHTTNTKNNQVIGNFVGTDLTGTSAPSWSYNSYTGITVEDGVINNVIADNVIGNNKTGGIQITGSLTTNNQVYNNRVGISTDGSAIGNHLFGIRVDGVSNTIGPNNIVANNRYSGIVIREADKDFNKITQNSIYSNGTTFDLGIDLLPPGPNPNDPGDGDTGPNEQLNYPVLTSATTQRVEGTACVDCTIEVFIADSGNGQYGEGKTFIGSGTADGSGAFSVNVSGVSAGSYVTATATDAANNTSEFSLNLVVQ